MQRSRALKSVTNTASPIENRPATASKLSHRSLETKADLLIDQPETNDAADIPETHVHPAKVLHNKLGGVEIWADEDDNRPPPTVSPPKSAARKQRIVPGTTSPVSERVLVFSFFLNLQQQ